MSCLMLSEIPLDEQIAIELEIAERTEQRYRQLAQHLLTGVPVRPESPVPTASREYGNPDHPAAPDGDTIMDRQHRNHPPLMACAHGHRPHMYLREANRESVYFVECSPCKVRTCLHPTPEAAATAWHDGEVVAIPHVAGAAAA